MFPALYHCHHSRYTEDIPFWLELAGQANNPVLELGCGTGRVLLPLVQAGHQVLGLDHDVEMLKFVAQRLSPEIKSRVGLFQSDMRHFHLSTRLGAIFLPCNTLSTLDETAMHELLSCISAHLSTGGIFAASLPNPELLASLPTVGEAEIEEIFPHPLDSEPVQVSSSWQRRGKLFSVTWTYDHLLPDGQVNRTQMVVNHLLYPLEFYHDALRNAGFDIIQTFGDFKKGAFRKNSTTIILSARYRRT